MTSKIIALDLDGTLLHSDGTISDYTKKTLKALEKQGHLPIITTGRPYRMAWDYYHELGLTTPMINFNGSLTHLPHKNWNKTLSITIDKSYLFSMLDQTEAFEMDALASEYRRKFYLTTLDDQIIAPELFGVKRFISKMQLQRDKITDDPNGILFQTHAQDKYALGETMRHYYKNEIEINTWGGPLNILECSAKGINKAFALNYLLDIYSKGRKDLIAFGDEHNDTEMLDFAGVGYAMKNCSPVLLPHADRQTQWTNDEDGVARTLENLFL